MLKEKLRKFVGKLSGTIYVPIGNEIGWKQKDVVDITQINENEISIKRVAE